MTEDVPPRKRPRRSCVVAQQRRQDNGDAARQVLQQLLQHYHNKVIVFTGAGLGAEAGLPTFTDNLYQQAARQFHLHNGQDVFGYRFLQQRPRDYWRFFAQTLYPSMTTRKRPTMTNMIDDDPSTRTAGFTTASP